MAALYYLFVFINPYLPMPRGFEVPPQSIICALFFLWLLSKLKSARWQDLHPLHFFIFYLFAWLLLADLTNLIRLRSITELRHLGGRFVFLTFVFTTFAIVRSQEKYNRVLKLLIITVSSLALFTTICGVFDINPLGAHTSRNPRTFWGISMPTKRAIGVSMSYGEYGIIINSILPLLLMAVWKKRFIVRRLWALAGIPILLSALVIGQSRNSWLATIFSLSFFFLLMLSQLPHYTLRGASFCFILGAVFLVSTCFPSVLSFAFQGFALGKHARTFENRLQVDELTIDLFSQNWVLGAGHAEISKQIATGMALEVNVHNGYLDQLAATGVIGFVPFILLISIALFLLIKIARTGSPSWRPYALCLAASFVANMSALLAYKGFFSETFAIQYGLMLSLLEMNNKSVINNSLHLPVE